MAKTLIEIVGLGDEMRTLLSNWIIENPNMTRKELAQQMDINVDTLAKFLLKNRPLQAGTAIKIHHFLHKLKLI